MRKTPNYFKFRQWLGWAMKDDPRGDDHFHADDVYQSNLLDEHEVFPATFVLSYGASMLEDARQYFRKRAYSSKIATFYCNLSDIENYDPTCFEHDNSIPDFSTLEKMAAWFPDKDWSPTISFYIRPIDELQAIFQHFKSLKHICTTAPSWFGLQYNMIYCKWVIHNDEMYGDYIDHQVEFYHSDAAGYYPFEKNKWYLGYPLDVCNLENVDSDVQGVS